MSTFLEHAPHLRRKNYRRAAALTRVNMVLLSLYTTQTRMNSCIQPYGYNPDIANWSLFYECSFITSFILFIKPRNLCIILRIYWNSVWRTINSIASILRENVYGYFSLDIICSSKLTVFFELCSRKTVRIFKLNR